MGVLAVLLSSWEFLKKSWEFLGVFWEFLEHSNTSVVIAQIVLTMHRGPLVAPGLKRFRKTIHSHTSQFSLLEQVPVPCSPVPSHFYLNGLVISK
jgi:hypothetical protein